MKKSTLKTLLLSFFIGVLSSNINAQNWFEGEEISLLECDTLSGIIIEDANQNLGSAKSGAYFVMNGVAFEKAGIYTFILNQSSNKPEGEWMSDITLFFDGDSIADIPLTGTGNWTNYVDMEHEIIVPQAYPNASIKFLIRNNGGWAGNVKYFMYFLDEEVSSAETIQDAKLNVYPNPATDFISINRSADVAIYTVTGKQIIQRAKVTVNERISVSDLSEGIYFIQITDALTSKVVTKKLIIK